jgi:hypothetical protein
MKAISQVKPILKNDVNKIVICCLTFDIRLKLLNLDLFFDFNGQYLIIIKRKHPKLNINIIKIGKTTANIDELPDNQQL